MPEIEFNGRAAVVTGAGGGLGRAYALELARRGAGVVVNDIRSAQPVVDEILAAGGKAVPSAESVTTRKGGEAIVQAALDAFGSVDIVVNNAGIVRDRSFANMADEEIGAVLDVHLRGAFNVSQPAYRVMKEKRYGRLLFITSAAGLFGNFGQANYTAAKMGLVGLARTLAIEGAKYGIQANALAPLALTSMTDGLFGGGLQAFDPEHVVPMATYLVSESCPLSGEVFSAGGGRFARVVVGVTPGWVFAEQAPRAEDILDHIDDISDAAELIFPASAVEEIELARSVI
jgi:NAD(P)-dependent dehydrogenase (short-subunit alcohol dehydrogenase family)